MAQLPLLGGQFSLTDLLWPGVTKIRLEAKAMENGTKAGHEADKKRGLFPAPSSFGAMDLEFAERAEVSGAGPSRSK